MSDIHSNRGIVLIQVFSGMGMGLLVGIIVGLSASEVVSIILGALAALLAAFLGLQDQRSPKKEQQGPAMATHRIIMSGLRAGSFGISCVAAILLGVFLRTHNVLSEETQDLTLKQQVAVWTDAGYGDVEARQYVAYQNLGILPKNAEVKTSTNKELRNKTKMGVLFSGESDVNYCHDLSFEANGGSVEEVLKAYRLTRNEDLINLASDIEKYFPPDAQAFILKDIEAVLCGINNSLNNIEFDDYYLLNICVQLAGFAVN